MYGMYCKSGFVFPPKQKLTKHGENEGISLFLCRLLCFLNHGINGGKWQQVRLSASYDMSSFSLSVIFLCWLLSCVSVLHKLVVFVVLL